MSYPKTITATEMRGINRSAILEIIRRESPISRTLIAERLDVSLPTVMRVIDDLIAEGLVRPHNYKQWSGGRRRSLIEFNCEDQVVIGIDMGGNRMFGGVADLGGKLLDETELSRLGTSGETSYERLGELIQKLLDSPRIAGRKVRGIAVGVPGVTLHKEGMIVWAPSLEWRNYPLKKKLLDQFHYPITVDNDVNLAALGELWFGAGQNARNIVLITIGAGIGAGIIIDGALYRGASEASGEIGYLLPGREFLGKRYDSFGALEDLVSGTGIVQRARETLVPRKSLEELANLEVEDVFTAARNGETWAKSIIDSAVDYLAIAVASLNCYFDPDVIILGGEVARYFESPVQAILQKIEGTIPYQVHLATSTLDRRAAVMGAITTILHNTSDFYVVHKLS
ncbi:MAG TPA: ROK family transcriptional regulator [Anaerolineaceae bacterium]|nr:ROK family transcriptional regulator [Anaerolineaceae bacterium]